MINRKTKVGFPLIVAATLLLPSVFAKAEQTHTVFDKYFLRGEGVAISKGVFLISDSGSVVHHKAYGVDGSSQSLKLTTDHKFDIGSVSKQFTAAAIMRLRDKNKLSFDDPLNKYIPEINYPGVTLRHLLNHTSGVPDIMRYFRRLFRGGQVDRPIDNQFMLSEMVTNSMPSEFKAGQEWKYSNTGYYLLANVIERVSGKTYSEFMVSEFFRPLGMNNTFVYDTNTSKQSVNNRSFGFTERYDGKIHQRDQIPNFFLVGAGGIYSTAGDLMAWSDAIVDGKLFSNSSWEQALQNTNYGDGQTKEYGFGWGLKPSKYGHKVLKHSGDWRGFSSGFAIYPEQERTVIMLTNNNIHREIDGVYSAIEDILEGHKPERLRENLSRVLYQASTSSDDDALELIAREVLNTSSENYSVDVKPINHLGYMLLERNEHEKALTVFELNKELNPEIPNTFDSLAEAYYFSGNKEAGKALFAEMSQKFPDFMDYENRLKEIEEESIKR